MYTLQTIHEIHERLLLATFASGTDQPVRLGLGLCHICLRSNLI